MSAGSARGKDTQGGGRAQGGETGAQNMSAGKDTRREYECSAAREDRRTQEI